MIIHVNKTEQTVCNVNGENVNMHCKKDTFSNVVAVILLEALGPDTKDDQRPQQELSLRFHSPEDLKDMISICKSALTYFDKYNGEQK